MNNIKLKGISILLPFIALVSCDSDEKQFSTSEQKKLIPSGEAFNIDVKFNESELLKANLKSEKMFDYSNAKYPFNHFPKKVNITVFDKELKKTIIVANKATAYNKTSIIELDGNVKITTHDGKVLETQKLYFDQKNNWFFTESYFKVTDANKSYFEGIGLDFDNQFKIINAQQNRGELNKIKDEDL